MATTKEKEKKEKHFEPNPAFALAPALYLCKRCNVRVLKRIWTDDGWKDLPTLQNALDGSEHDCKSTQKEQKKGANTWLQALKD